MKTKRKAVVICILAFSLLISGCGPGGLFGPTLTPTPTNTLTPTNTPTPTTSVFTDTPSDTPTPTFTPTPTYSPTETEIYIATPNLQPIETLIGTLSDFGTD